MFLRLKLPTLCLCLALTLTFWGHGKAHAEDVLRICIADNTPPYTFTDAQGQWQGFDVAVIEHMNLPFTPEFIATDFSMARAELSEGRCQMFLLSTVINEENKKHFIFTTPHLSTDLHALIRQNSPIVSNEELAYSILGVTRRSDAEYYAFQTFKESTIISLTDTQDLMQLLHTGDIEAIIERESALKQLQAQNTDLRVLEPALTYLQFGYIISKNAHTLEELINEKITQLQMDGTLEELYNTWFTTPLSKPKESTAE